MVEVQILHGYTDVTYQGNEGAIAEEQISVRPVMDINVSLQVEKIAPCIFLTSHIHVGRK
jgi:hypothetical protein